LLEECGQECWVIKLNENRFGNKNEQTFKEAIEKKFSSDFVLEKCLMTLLGNFLNTNVLKYKKINLYLAT